MYIEIFVYCRLRRVEKFVLKMWDVIVKTLSKLSVLGICKFSKKVKFWPDGVTARSWVNSVFPRFFSWVRILNLLKVKELIIINIVIFKH